MAEKSGELEVKMIEPLLSIRLLSCFGSKKLEGR